MDQLTMQIIGAEQHLCVRPPQLLTLNRLPEEPINDFQFLLHFLIRYYILVKKALIAIGVNLKRTFIFDLHFFLKLLPVYDFLLFTFL